MDWISSNSICPKFDRHKMPIFWGGQTPHPPGWDKIQGFAKKSQLRDPLPGCQGGGEEVWSIKDRTDDAHPFYHQFFLRREQICDLSDVDEQLHEYEVHHPDN